VNKKQQDADDPDNEVIVVTKESAAKSQLETAISLWFDYGDPVSIHALTVAANECLHAIGKPMGKPSAVQDWIKLQPKKVQKEMTAAQNFFKHGHRDRDQAFRYQPMHGEVLISDSVMTYQDLFGEVTPLMRAFALRFVVTNAGAFLRVFLNEGIDEEEVEKLAKLSRPEFLTEVRHLFTEAER